MKTINGISLLTAFLLGSVVTAATHGAPDRAPSDAAARPQAPALSLHAFCTADTDACWLEVRGGRQSEVLLMVFGLESANLQLPWGVPLLVRPDLILAFGTFPQSGIIRIPQDSDGDGIYRKRDAVGDARAPLGVSRAPNALWAQAFAVDTNPDVAEPIRASNALSLPIDFAREDPFSAQLFATDSIPHYYSVEIALRVPTTGHDLRLDSIDTVPNADGAIGSTIVYVRHVKPADGEVVMPVMQTLRLRVDLGSEPGCRVEIWMGENPDLTTYVKKAELLVCER